MSAKDLELVLEEKCKACDGGGVSYGDSCPSCRGFGYVPTENGEKILTLMRRHLRNLRNLEH